MTHTGGRGISQLEKFLEQREASAVKIGRLGIRSRYHYCIYGTSKTGTPQAWQKSVLGEELEKDYDFFMFGAFPPLRHRVTGYLHVGEILHAQR